MSDVPLQGLPARWPLRKLLVATALAAIALCAAGASPAQASCAGESSTPSHLSTFEARATLFCLINQQRAASGLAALTPNTSLGRAAEHHSRAMNARNFFGHEPDGTPASRARRAGYMAGASWWTVGETLAWGRGSRGTPSGIMAAMMASPIHSAVILDPRFREIGVGVAMGVPLNESGRNAAIYTVEFGVRK